MSNSSINIIRSEHRSIAAVSHGLLHFARCVRERTPLTNFKVFRAMLYYLDVFVERFHHPKEDRYLFAKLRQRSKKSVDVIARLENDHTRGEQSIRDLMQSAIRFELGG